ncbi:MAG TPA: DUF177 domain-containing protein [Candidatus Saccharimonadales bacterium]|nr:DUF177 domain-containing protein [Candidatus Saccharimonadales bacterium]
MIIRVADLEPEGRHVEAPLRIGPLRSDANEPICIEDAFLRGDVRRTSRGAEVLGHLICRAVVPCARCLELFPVDVDRAFHVRYAFAAPMGKDIEIPEEDLDVDFLEADGLLDLAAVASEQIYLELPMKPVCRPACRGLCPRCGENLNRGGCACSAGLPEA